MRLLVLALCAWLATALPTSYDVADNEVGTSKVFKSGEVSTTSDEASYFYSNEGETIIEITVAEASQYNLVCMPSKQLVDSAQLIVQETIDEEAEAAAAAAAAGAGEGGAATSAVSGGGAAAAAGAGEGGAATSAVSGGGAAAAAGAGEGGAATSAVSGGGAAAAAGAGEGGAATSAVSSGGAAAAAGAGEGGAATSAVSGGGAAASAGAGEGGAATSAVSGGGAAASASFGSETTSTSTSAAIYIEEGPSDLEKCTCVPFFLCEEKDLISDGTGAIDVRFGSAGTPTNSKCDNFDHVCCLHPREKPVDWFVEELLAEPYHPNCGHRQPDGFGFSIEGFKDSEAQFAEFPWMAIIMIEEYQHGEPALRYVCGGSLIAKGVILTAAHCVDGKATDKLVVRLGDWNTNSVAELLPHQEFRVAHAVSHERFNKLSLFNTVALLFLDREVEFQPHIDTICLPTEYDLSLGQPFYDASKCVATGFGREQFEDKQNQNIMKQVDLAEISHKSCQKKLRKTRLGRWFRLHKSFTCAGGKPGVDTCRGDGGGPLVCPLLSDPNKYVQVGIVAWGIGCGERGVPGVYASVLQLLPWIREHLAVEPGHTLEELEQTHEPVQVCITQNPLEQYQEIPVVVGGPPPPPPPPVDVHYQQQQTVHY